MTTTRSIALAFTLTVVTTASAAGQPAADALFTTSDMCMSCHNNITTSAGEDISFGVQWRPTMMANAARDPYWQASVRRETLDHPQHAAAIEHECAACHMPNVRYNAKLAGTKAPVFSQAPALGLTTPSAQLAADGVGCTVCHRMADDASLGERASFTAGFVIEPLTPAGGQVLGPFAPEPGNAAVMRSAVGFAPAEGKHLAKSEVCATCHTLFTHALGAKGGELPEQVPYLEWRHSAYRETKSCQDCHMPEAPAGTLVSSVLGEPRDNVSTHAFAGGNFFMPRILARHRDELRVLALPQELDAAAARATRHLQTMAADVGIGNAVRTRGTVAFDVVVTNRAGHKLPTAYPSRRAWLHTTVTDQTGKVVFESGALEPDGRIRGNDNDADGARYEPHHREIRSSDAVQIYEPILADENGNVTTGLLTAVRYVKDNRLLPEGFTKAGAPADVAVHGEALTDDDFTAGSDRVRYVADVSQGEGPFTIEVALVYQPIAFRWAQNLGAHRSLETDRFVSYYKEAATGSAVVLARATARSE
jgi:hypothetical protein